MKQAIENINPATGLLGGSFGVGTYEAGERNFPGIVRPNGDVIDVSSNFHDTHAIFDNWDRNFDALVDLEATRESVYSLDSVRPLPPLAHPNLLCAGSNYKQHVAEMLTKNKFNQHSRLPDETDEQFFKRNYAAMEVRAREGTPFFWTGLHSSLSGAQDDLTLPFLGEQPDWELELAAVVGKSARYATVDEAANLVAGYVMVNDLGTVDLFRRTDVHFGYDWIGKHQPGFKIAGPFIVPSAFLALTDEVRIKLKVNGNVMQDWPINDMIFSIPQFLAYASERIRLMPGDLLLTGSPPGNGAHHGRFLQPGDVMDSEITYLGRQRNVCRQEEMNGRKPVFGLWKNREGT
jgi:2-keto-4-pentenoate hydratase/2-oxohepta-3-ene-1,7-dioic acid hydratase in catechol pathway